jgi:hypothetical protein
MGVLAQLANQSFAEDRQLRSGRAGVPQSAYCPLANPAAVVESLKHCAQEIQIALGDLNRGLAQVGEDSLDRRLAALQKRGQLVGVHGQCAKFQGEDSADQASLPPVVRVVIAERAYHTEDLLQHRKLSIPVVLLGR